MVTVKMMMVNGDGNGGHEGCNRNSENGDVLVVTLMTSAVTLMMVAGNGDGGDCYYCCIAILFSPILDVS